MSSLLLKFPRKKNILTSITWIQTYPLRLSFSSSSTSSPPSPIPLADPNQRNEMQALWKQALVNQQTQEMEERKEKEKEKVNHAALHHDSLQSKEEPVTKENLNSKDMDLIQLDRNVYQPFPNDMHPNTKEIGGPKGPEPTRYGDWERKGRVIDF